MKNAVMLADIRSQGEALAQGLVETRTQVAALRLHRVERIVLTGSGDSWIAACAVQQLFQDHCRVPVVALPSLDASRYVRHGHGDLVVVLSVSGEVARTIEVATRAKAEGARTVAITASATSSLATVCDAVLTIPMPIDRSIPHSRDYTVTLMALAGLLEGIVGAVFPELDALPALSAEVIDSALSSVRPVRDPEVRTWFLGAGPDRATAMFGALKYWEAAGIEAWWDDLEEFAHGSQLMARPGDRVVLISAGPGCQRALEMVAGFERMGLEVVVVGGTEMASGGRPHLFTADGLDARWHPFVACLPIQALTYGEAEARGLDVSIALFGRPYGVTYDAVHVEWTKGSRVVLGDGHAR